jgi:two-component system NarL family response regulator
MTNVRIEQWKPIRLLIVDDHEVIRQGLRAIFSAHRDLTIVGEAADPAEAVAVAAGVSCDVAVVDLRLQRGSGMDVIRAVAEISPACRYVVLTNYATECWIQEATAAGALGYVMKHGTPAEIVTAVRTVHSGRRYLSADVREVLRHYAHTSALTGRERQILDLLVPGTRNRRIAQLLAITEETVKTHVKNILLKIGAKDRTEAVTKAIQRGLVRLEDRRHHSE